MSVQIFDMNEGSDYGTEELFQDAYEQPKKKNRSKKESPKLKELPLELPLQEHDWVRNND